MTDASANLIAPSELRVAIVHYWFVGYTGGEQVVNALAEMFPQADLFALVAKPECLPPSLRSHKLYTSFLQNIPGSRRWHRHFLPLHPFALEQLDLSGYDLVISSESGPAKGVVTPSSTCHICYCHSPMRYIWDMYHPYRKEMVGPVRAIFSLTAHYMRLWDLATASRVDHFVANSEYVASRIRKHYRRDASVIYPPVSVAAGYLSDRIEDYYLVVSRLIDYKRVDLAIEACKRLGRRLRVVGDGDQYKRLRKLAGPATEFVGYLSNRDLHQAYAGCRALLFPGEEDFGMIPVEAQSFGRPVIAYGRGGALETVIDVTRDESLGPEASSGIFFGEQRPESLLDAILLFESMESRFNPSLIRSNAQRFDVSQFKTRMGEFIGQCWLQHPISSVVSRNPVACVSRFNPGPGDNAKRSTVA
jgi:glycosyltransferase involved in cell wall biosynthesis